LFVLACQHLKRPKENARTQQTTDYRLADHDTKKSVAMGGNRVTRNRSPCQKRFRL